jgi:hypothetical protein
VPFANVKSRRASFPIAVSPFYANPTKNVFRDSLFNGVRRMGKHLPYWTIPFAIGALLLSIGSPGH